MTLFETLLQLYYVAVTNANFGHSSQVISMQNLQTDNPLKKTAVFLVLERPFLSCHFQWSIFHRPLFSTELNLELLSPSSNRIRSMLLSFLSPGLSQFPMYFWSPYSSSIRCSVPDWQCINLLILACVQPGAFPSYHRYLSSSLHYFVWPMYVYSLSYTLVDEDL